MQIIALRLISLLTLLTNFTFKTNLSDIYTEKSADNRKTQLFFGEVSKRLHHSLPVFRECHIKFWWK